MLSDLSLFNRLVDELIKLEKTNPVVSPIAPSELLETLDIELREEPQMEEDFSESLRQIVEATPRTASSMFFNQLFGGRQGKAVLGDLLAVVLNSSMYTYKVAGPQVGIEREIIAKLNDLVGYPKNAAGTIAPGGSMSNLMAMIMARDMVDPLAASQGMSHSLTVYTSAESHYSIQKNAAFIGIGRQNVRYVPAMADGTMNVKELREMIAKDVLDGHSPMMINATAGTTVLGAFDPIIELAEIAAEYAIWLHVDGAYCGSVIFSDEKKHLVEGLNQADSFSLNAHKMLMTPLTCSLILTKHKDQLYTSFANDADYLYQTDEDDFNLGKTSLQCGRRNDALKFWTLWKSVGTSGLRSLVDHQFELADFARNYVRNNPDYTDFSIDDSLSICFNYKGYTAKSICTQLYEQSEMMVGFGQFREEEFIRLVTINANNSIEDIEHFFSHLENFCDENPALLEEVKTKVNAN